MVICKMRFKVQALNPIRSSLAFTVRVSYLECVVIESGRSSARLERGAFGAKVVGSRNEGVYTAESKNGKIPYESH